MGMICDCEPFEVCPSCAPPWRGDGTVVIESQRACQHNHAANYDPALVVAGKPIEVLSGGQLKCFDCGEVIAPSVEVPRRYTLAEMKTLIAQWINEQDGDTEMLKWTMSILIEWLAKRERELRG